MDWAEQNNVSSAVGGLTTFGKGGSYFHIIGDGYFNTSSAGTMTTVTLEAAQFTPIANNTTFGPGGEGRVTMILTRIN